MKNINMCSDPLLTLGSFINPNGVMRYTQKASYAFPPTQATIMTVTAR